MALGFNLGFNRGAAATNVQPGVAASALISRQGAARPGAIIAVAYWGWREIAPRSGPRF